MKLVDNRQIWFLRWLENQCCQNLQLWSLHYHKQFISHIFKSKCLKKKYLLLLTWFRNRQSWQHWCLADPGKLCKPNLSNCKLWMWVRKTSLKRSWRVNWIFLVECLYSEQQRDGRTWKRIFGYLSEWYAQLVTKEENIFFLDYLNANHLWCPHRKQTMDKVYTNRYLKKHNLDKKCQMSFD